MDTDKIDLERTLGEMLASNTDLSPDEIAKYTSNIQIVDDARMPYADDRPIDLLLNSSGGIAPDYMVTYNTNLVNCWKAYIIYIGQSAAKLIFNDYNGSTTIERLLYIIYNRIE